MNWVDALYDTLYSYRDGNCNISINYQRPDAKAGLNLGKQWKIKPTDELIKRLINQFGENNVVMHYD